MTSKLDEELERLSKAATQGVWEVETDYHGQPFPGIVYPESPYEFADFSVGEVANENQANASLCVALVNAYRTGQLVPAQPSGDVVELVERVVDIIASRVSSPTICARNAEFKAAHREDQRVAAHEIIAAITTYEAVSGVAKMRDAALALIDALKSEKHYFGDEYNALCAALGEQP